MIGTYLNHLVVERESQDNGHTVGSTRWSDDADVWMIAVP